MMRKNTAVLALLFIAIVQIQTAVAEKVMDIGHQQMAEQITPQLEADAKEVFRYIQTSQRLRERLPQFVEDANAAIQQHKGAIPSALALSMALSLHEADNMRNKLFKHALNHRSALYRVDQQISDQERIAEITIAMSAAVLLYENHQAMRDSFKDQALLRQKLNEGYPELGIAPGYYRSSMLRAGNLEYRKTMMDAIQYFNDNQTTIQQHLANSSETLQALCRYISQSNLLSTYSGGNALKEVLKLPFKAITEVREIQTVSLKELKFSSSRLLGNTLGLVRWREGKLKNNEALIQMVVSQLQPGDILLEKTPFTLTDKTIPGHFGHAAVYIGTAEQLKALHMQDMPEVRKHLDKINSGAGVVEALRNGVQLNNIQEFMNIDDFAVLRPKHLTESQQVKAVKIALSNVGKRYDFNFDVNTTETIVCSELVYIAYPHIDFVTKRVLDSYTISPDDIAVQAGQAENYPLALVLFAHNGQLVLDQHTDQDGQALYASFVRPPPRNLNADTASKDFFRGFIASQ